jgi:hypothetical protein
VCVCVCVCVCVRVCVCTSVSAAQEARTRSARVAMWIERVEMNLKCLRTYVQEGKLQVAVWAQPQGGCDGCAMQMAVWGEPQGDAYEKESCMWRYGLNLKGDAMGVLCRWRCGVNLKGMRTKRKAGCGGVGSISRWMRWVCHADGGVG